MRLPSQALILDCEIRFAIFGVRKGLMDWSRVFWSGSQRSSRHPNQVVCVKLVISLPEKCVDCAPPQDQCVHFWVVRIKAIE